MIKMLRESDDKITAKSYYQLISKLEKRGYDCKDCYEGDDYLYLRKDGDSYEAEYYKKDNGTYELYLGNIHPAKKTEGCCGKCHKKESVSRKSRRKLKESCNIDMWYDEEFNPEDYYVDCTFYPNEGEYRGNIYRTSDGKCVGDFSCSDSVEIERTFGKMNWNESVSRKSRRGLKEGIETGQIANDIQDCEYFIYTLHKKLKEISNLNEQLRQNRRAVDIDVVNTKANKYSDEMTLALGKAMRQAKFLQEELENIVDNT